MLSVFLILGFTFGVDSSQKAAATVTGMNQLASYDYTNTHAERGSPATLSDDGNFVVFASTNSSIVSSDSNGITRDLFIRSMQTNSTSLVDQSTNGVQAASGVSVPTTGASFAVSKTGRYVLFVSVDPYLIDGQTISDGNEHVYLRDTVSNTTSLIDQTSGGTIGNASATPVVVSDEGRFVFFTSNADNLLSSGNPSNTNWSYLYMKDMTNGSIQMISRSNSGSVANEPISHASASCDGSLVVFGSTATNLTPSNNGHSSVYLVDLRSGFNITNLTLSANNDTSTGSISCDGRYIALNSKATNLTTDSVSGTVNHIFRYDRVSGQYLLMDKSSDGAIASDGSSFIGQAGRSVSDNGGVIFATYDTNLVSPSASSHYEIYLRTPEANTTELVPINSSGQEGSPGPSGWTHTMAISADGKSIVYTDLNLEINP